MKHIILITSALILLTACHKIDGVNPAQNKALNTISGIKEKKQSGYMQQALDNWIKNDWTPTVEKNEKIKRKKQR